MSPGALPTAYSSGSGVLYRFGVGWNHREAAPAPPTTKAQSMLTPFRTLLAAAAVGAIALLPSLATSAPAGVQPGDQPDYTWRSPLVNSMGKSSLTDLQGSMVLVEFWGTR
mgnify:CR=1 FL=1